MPQILSWTNFVTIYYRMISWAMLLTRLTVLMIHQRRTKVGWGCMF